MCIAAQKLLRKRRGAPTFVVAEYSYFESSLFTGFEAPRNSLDVANLEAADDSRSSIFRSDDIPVSS